MVKNLTLLVLSCFLLMGIGCSSKVEQTSAESKSPAITDADNTARNAADRAGATQTSGDQAENATDLKISADVRQAVVGDKSLSTNAHNVKIITSGGIVTLRGPVKSREERESIESKAKQVAGVIRVENLLEIEKNH